MLGSLISPLENLKNGRPLQGGESLKLLAIECYYFGAEHAQMVVEGYSFQDLNYVVQGFSLGKLKHLVLDEADRLLNMDFEQEIDQILKVIPKERRTQLFSATMTSKVWLLAFSSSQSCSRSIRFAVSTSRSSQGVL